jgi:TPR repeat protein
MCQQCPTGRIGDAPTRALLGLALLVSLASACSPPDTPGSRCGVFLDATLAESQYQTGLARLADARDGEHFRSESFDEAMTALRAAAENGHLAAQSLYGRTLFVVLFSARAPVPEEREDYVSALTFLRVAIRAGEPQASAFMPALASNVTAPVAAPLDTLPPDWLRDAIERSDAWINCHGVPVASAPGAGSG